MFICADTHVHLFDCYDLEQALLGAGERLRQSAARVSSQPSLPLLFLADRRGFRPSRELLCQAPSSSRGFSIEEDRSVFRVTRLDQKEIIVLPGAQIVTKERIEVLALATADGFPDGEPLELTLQRVKESGAVGVLPWSPGKWWFERGRRLWELLERGSSEGLLFGDIAMRPAFWGTPRHFARFAGDQHPVICGSDPLPASGEENLVGSYGSGAEFSFNFGEPLVSARAFLQLKTLATLGARIPWYQFLTRMNRSRSLKREIDNSISSR